MQSDTIQSFYYYLYHPFIFVPTYFYRVYVIYL